MSSFIKFSLKNKLAIWILTIIVIFAGLYSGFNMKEETLPNISIPVLSVSATYDGASPQEVNDKVAEPIEQAVKNLNGVDSVSTTSNQGSASIQLEYKYSKDLDTAQTELKEALDKVQLPDNVEKPSVSKFSIDSFPIYTLSISDKNKSLSELTKYVEKTIVPDLQGIDGIANVAVSGQYVKEGKLTFKQAKLKQYGLTEDAVKQYIQNTDTATPLGLYTFDNTQKSVVVNGKVTTVNKLESIEIPLTSSQNAQPAAGLTREAGIPTVKLGDIASVKVVGKAESISRTNGKESIGLQIVKGSDANTVSAVQAVKDKMKDVKKDNKGLSYSSTLDQAQPIKESVQTMLDKALFGTAFAILIILLFLRDIRSTIISIISIPVSLLITLLILHQMDISLNMMTLGALTMAIGRVIDDSIVVIENIHRRMSQRGEVLKGSELILSATKEMFIPIMSSTIVTVAVYVPLAFVGGQIGQLITPFALAIVFALGASLLIAITIVPMMAHILFKNGVKIKEHKKEHGKLATFYARVLNWSLNHKIITFVIAILLLVGSIFLVPKIGFSFIPSDEQKQMIVSYKPEPGETVKEESKIADKVEKYFLDKNKVKNFQFSIGGSNPMNPSASNQGLFFVDYKSNTANFEKEKAKVLKDLASLSDNKGDWGEINMSSGGSSNDMTLNVNGESMSDIKPVVNKVEDIMKKQTGIKDVKSGLSAQYDEYTFVPNQTKLSQYGLTTNQIAMAINQNQPQTVIATVKSGDEDVNVYVSQDKTSYKSVKDLENKTIQTATGQTIKLKDVANIQEGKTSNTVTRLDDKFSVSVSGEITAKDVRSITQAVQKETDKLEKPDGVSISTGGVSDQMNDSFKKMGLAMLAAIAIVYFVLVVTFGGGLAPFAILFSLPFTIIGGLVGLFISGETISISALIGALMLIGIVVTNAIVLIDRVIHKENEGIGTREALLEAGKTRLRPILMTAIATIGALIPLAVGFESGGGLMNKGLGVTVIGGLTSSTLLTLLIVPIVYETISKLKRKKR